MDNKLANIIKNLELRVTNQWDMIILVVSDQKFENEIIENKQLSEAVFKRVSILDCKFEKIDFRGSRFDHCTFVNCKFNQLNLNDSYFSKCKFSNCAFFNSEILSANFKLCNFSNCKFKDIFFGITDFSLSCFEDTIFEKAKF